VAHLLAGGISSCPCLTQIALDRPPRLPHHITHDIVGCVAWGIVEQHPEVRDYLENLSDKEFGRVAFYIDLLEREGNRLGFPTVSHLGGKVWELRIPMGREARRITYHILTGRRIVLLTTFKKTQRNEKAEVARAHREWERCLAEGHTLDGDDE
jgi:phage-related protein